METPDKQDLLNYLEASLVRLEARVQSLSARVQELEARQPSQAQIKHG